MAFNRGSSVFLSSFSSKGWNETELGASPFLARLQYFRNENQGPNWLQFKELPWAEEAPGSPTQLDMMKSESDNFLLMSIDNGSTLQSDLLVIEFDLSMNYYGMSRAGEELNPINKRILAVGLQSLITSYCRQLNQDRERFTELRKHVTEERKEIQDLKDELQKKQENYGLSIVGFAQEILKELSKREDRIFKLGDSAITKLKKYDGPFHWLSQAVEKAAFAALHFSDSHEGPVYIESGDLLMNPPKESTVTTSNKTTTTDKYASTIEFLDRYEASAQRAGQIGEKITGKSIAANCQPPISPPAVSDVLKKHRSKIIKLMKRYPQKWPILRSSFRPLIRILDDPESSSELKLRTA